ncbi:hypothetical protein D8674_019738 [Pyrus ussuriensis x Pyrus communis]|uniref:Uncharacterized protein n=1 Tax=Pyrus ussuriensis x Pyrus communis TaxID=2448454 RepID=A0A5N5G8L3_9ROSA|nr:hypothetical protein D8674_019738 [Pyrus ussuriensis x Pyrus communis]
MEDKNKDQRMPANPYDLRQHVEFAHAIGKLMEVALKGGYKRWRYDLEQNGGPSK